MQDFKIILIGGGSSSGKSVLAKDLSKKIGINLLSLDDVRIAIQQTHSKDHVINYFLRQEVFTKESIKTLVEKHNDVSKIVCGGLLSIIGHHELTQDSVIIEGDDILPEFVAKLVGKEYVKFVFIYETNSKSIKSNITERGRGAQQLSNDQLDKMIDFIVADNKRIFEEVKRFNLPVLKARPYHSLLQRVQERIYIKNNVLCEALYQI